MTIMSKRAAWILLVGDIAVFTASLWVTLALRYVELPTSFVFFDHLAPFSFLFIVWLIIFFISGLYDKQSIVFKSRLLGTLIRSQIANMLVATAFFYFIPWYGISPKTTLFLYLLVSLGLILVWRIYGYVLLVPRSRERAVIIGSGKEMHELVHEIQSNKNYTIDLATIIDLDTVGDLTLDDIRSWNVSVAIVDLHNDKARRILPTLYNLLFSRVRFIDIDDMYESIFDRVPLTLVKYAWFLDNVSASPKALYDSLKRFMDISLGLILALISLVVYPFVALAIKGEDGGPVLIFQDRVGKSGKPIRIAKFRSMSVSAQDASGASKPQSVTRVGSFIRKTRIDELPQLWSVIGGSLSLIGPRPELPQFVTIYDRDIPFYNIRHLIKPGLSGWAQLYHTTPPKFEASNEDTAMKLSYDLYYIKNRSFLLDLTIALKTVKELVSRKGV